MKKIDLDVNLERDGGMGMSVPSGPSHYPEFSFEEDEPCDIPEEGELTIKYRLVRHATDTTNEDRPKYSYTICVKKLISAVGESDKSPTRKYSEGGEALDALVAAKNEEKDDEY